MIQLHSCQSSEPLGCYGIQTSILSAELPLPVIGRIPEISNDRYAWRAAKIFAINLLSAILFQFVIESKSWLELVNLEMNNSIPFINCRSLAKTKAKTNAYKEAFTSWEMLVRTILSSSLLEKSKVWNKFLWSPTQSNTRVEKTHLAS